MLLFRFKFLYLKYTFNFICRFEAYKPTYFSVLKFKLNLDFLKVHKVNRLGEVHKKGDWVFLWICGLKDSTLK